MKLQGFIGPSNRLTALQADPEETINLFPVRVDAGTPKSPIPARLIPGLTRGWRLPSAPVRGLFSQDGRTFGVSGDHFAELLQSQNTTDHGTVAVDANPATISSNGTAGHQLFITSGGSGYIFDLDTDTLTLITDDAFPVPVLMGTYLDGYFLALKTNSIQVFYSSLEDGDEWDGTEFLAVSQYSDNIVSMIVNHRDLWLFGSQHTQAWSNVGDANTPFQPISSAYLEVGCAASFSPAQFDNSIVWLGADSRGSRVVYRANGYNPERISTHSIEAYLNALPRVDDAIGYTYQQEGHTFYNLYCPTARHTLVYDASSQMWHKRAVWDQTQCRFYPDIPRASCYGFNKVLVGDRQSGGVYGVSLDEYTYNIINAGGIFS